jgi:hypothetical protein
MCSARSRRAETTSTHRGTLEQAQESSLAEASHQGKEARGEEEGERPTRVGRALGNGMIKAQRKTLAIAFRLRCASDRCPGFWPTPIDWTGSRVWREFTFDTMHLVTW